MDWLYYLLEANLYLIIFYGFYRLLLQHQTFYNSNRYYLLLSSLTAFALPILQIGYLRPAQIVTQIVVQETAAVASQPLSQAEPSLQRKDYLYIFYICIVACFALRLLLATYKIVKLWLVSKKHRNENFTIIELKDEKEAFSFFNLLFIHPQLAEKQVVLKHELVHIRQKHTLDVLFFELLQIVCWFNPIIYFIKKDVKLLHEYIADELSATTNQQKHEYVMFLIENSFGVVPHQLTNQIFNQSILKRRINMLNKKRTTNWARLRLLLALPLGGAMLCTSTMAFTKDYGYVDLFPEKNKTTNGPLAEATTVQEPAQSEGKTFYPRNEYSKSKGETAVIVDKRYIVINGKPVADVSRFHGVSQASSITYLNAADAVRKYGDKGKHGAVEISGTQLKYLELVPPPLPESKGMSKDQVRFPPPRIKANKNRPAPAPLAIEPAPASAKNSVKFPPPAVKANQVTPPPAIAEKPVKIKVRKARAIEPKAGDVVKFPPPVIKEERKNNDDVALKAKIAALPSVSIASTNPENAKKRYATKENQIAITNVEQAQAVKSDPKPIYSITLKEPQERLKSIQVKEPDQTPGTKGGQQNLRITVKPSVKETKKEAKQPITLELLPSKNQP